jgi:hypothetical protein
VTKLDEIAGYQQSELDEIQSHLPVLTYDPWREDKKDEFSAVLCPDGGVIGRNSPWAERFSSLNRWHVYCVEKTEDEYEGNLKPVSDD